MKFFVLLPALLFSALFCHAQRLYIGPTVGLFIQRYQYNDPGGYMLQTRFIPVGAINPGFSLGYEFRNKFIVETGINRSLYQTNINFLAPPPSTTSASSLWIWQLRGYYKLFSMTMFGFPRTKVYALGSANLHKFFHPGVKGWGTRRVSGTMDGKPFEINSYHTKTLPHSVISTVELGTSIRYGLDRNERLIVAVNVSRVFGFTDAVVTDVIYDFNKQKEYSAKITSSGAGIKVFATLYYNFNIGRKSPAAN